MRVSKFVGIAAAIALGVSAGAVGVAVAAPGTARLSKSAVPLPKATTNATAVVTRPMKIDSLFVPVTSCRIADSRTPGIQLAGTARTLQIAGTTGFTTQGGTSAGCGVPAAATAVAVSVTALNETLPGYVTLYPTGATRPAVGTQLSYSPGVQITNSATVALSAAGQINAFVGANSGGKTNLLFDVTGCYEPQIEAYVTATGDLYSSTARVLSAASAQTGSYVITVDTSVYNCVTSVTVGGGAGLYTAYAVTASDNNVDVNIFRQDPTSEATTPADVDFNFTVTC